MEAIGRACRVDRTMVVLVVHVIFMNFGNLKFWNRVRIELLDGTTVKHTFGVLKSS